MYVKYVKIVRFLLKKINIKLTFYSLLINAINRLLPQPRRSCMEMRLCEGGAEGIDIILLKGDCDLYMAPSFRNTILIRIGKGLRNLKLDFSGVSYLDSTGVGAIIQIIQAMKAVNGKIVFSGISGSPKRVLELSNVISVMKIVD